MGVASIRLYRSKKEDDMKKTLLVILLAVVLAMSFAYAHDRGRHDDRDDDCRCACQQAPVTQAYIRTFSTWGGYGALTLIDLDNYPPAYHQWITVTAIDTPVPSTGKAKVEQFFFHGEFINDIPVYEIES